MDEKNGSTIEKNISDFMLAEYQTLRELRINLDSLGESRVSSFLTTISIGAVALGLINQLSLLPDMLYFINVAIFAGLLLLGFTTFTRMVERTARGVEYMRGMNRVRRYFADKHPEIKPYLWLPVHDESPAFGYSIINLKEKRWGLTGLAMIIGVINSVIATVGIVLLLRGLIALPVNWLFVTGVLIFLLGSFLHYRYLVNRMNYKRNSIDIRFPKTES